MLMLGTRHRTYCCLSLFSLASGRSVGLTLSTSCSVQICKVRTPNAAMGHGIAHTQLQEGSKVFFVGLGRNRFLVKKMSTPTASQEPCESRKNPGRIQQHQARGGLCLWALFAVSHQPVCLAGGWWLMLVCSERKYCWLVVGLFWEKKVGR
jgi:hypothetical protein